MNETFCPVIRVDELGEDDLKIYTELNENQLRHYFEPAEEGIFIAETANVVRRALDAGYQPISLLIEERYVNTEAKDIIDRFFHIAEGEKRMIPIYVSSVRSMSKMTGYNLTRGILTAFRRKKMPSVEAVCRNARTIAILEHVENPTNIGAIFRSAAAMGVDAVLVSEGCADPLQRRAIRVSVGTVFQIPWARIPRNAWPEDTIKWLHDHDFTVSSMALKDNTVSIDDPRLKKCSHIAICLGNEGSGLTDNTISLSDYTVKIPMREGVDSLNVAAASAVAFWETTKTRFN